MQRNLRVNVDQATWPPAPNLPAFPAEFTAGSQVWDVNITALLVTIGYLTTPSYASGVSLSEYWAWVRYIHALVDSADFQLTKSFHELDAHQKTILSDDFGMGAPIYWLFQKLQIGPIADGKYFIDRMHATVGFTAVGTKKQGPQKSPDFVAQDLNGVWHVIECKGTQTSLAYRKKQLGIGAQVPSGALAQKQTIIFPNGHTGQKLATGLFIGVEGDRNTSELLIIDPEGEGVGSVSETDLDFASDAISRGVSGRVLRLAGFPDTSSLVAAPAGTGPKAKAYKGSRFESMRTRIVDQKRNRAKEELDRKSDRIAFVSNDKSYIGRKIKMDLAKAVRINGRVSNSVILEYGVENEFLNFVEHRALNIDALSEPLSDMHALQTRTGLEGSTRSAQLSIGDAFVSKMTFD